MRQRHCGQNDSRTYQTEVDAHHVAHLIGDILQPVLYTLRTRDHRGQFGPDDSHGRERLPKGFALLDPPVRAKSARGLIVAVGGDR